MEIKNKLKMLPTIQENLASKVQNSKIFREATLLDWKERMVDIANGTARLYKEAELFQTEIRAMKDNSSQDPDLKRVKLNVSSILSR